MTPTIISISLPPDQLELLSRIENKLAKLHTANNAEVWLTMEEVCERLKVKESTIRKWMSDYQLPYSGLGEVKRFSSAKVDKWFEKFSSDNFSEGMKLINNAKKRKAA